MKVIFVKNYTHKLLLSAFLIVLWITMFLLADTIIRSSLLFNLTIGSCMQFSYPYGIVVDNILVSEKADESIQTVHSTSVPVIQGFTTYKSIEGKFSFDYPSAFVLNPQNLSGGEILYHIDFRNASDTAHGLVQVWNMPGNLSEFLKNSKSLSNMKFKYFKTGTVTVNGIPGYLWDYMVLSDSGYTKAMEVFLKKGERMYRISYFVPEKEWNSSQMQLFRNMVSSFRIY